MPYCSASRNRASSFRSKKKTSAGCRKSRARHNVPMQVIGAVGGTRFSIQPLVQLPVEELKSIWSNGLTARLK